MLIISRLFQILAISLLINLVQSQANLKKDQYNRIIANQQSQLIKERLDNLESQINNMNLQLSVGFNEKAKAMNELQNDATKKMQQLTEIGKQIHAWSEFLKKLNQYVAKGNNAMVAFNDKVATLMTKMVGFEQQMKAIVSLDTLVVCILSLVLVKILKDQFIDEGYQPVSDSTRLYVGDMPSNAVLGEHEIAQ